MEARALLLWKHLLIQVVKAAYLQDLSLGGIIAFLARAPGSPSSVV